MDRVVPDGKHLRVGSTPFRVKGVTYGHFVPRADGHRFPESQQLERDLTAIAANGFNTVRTYCVPPLDLLDGARALGLRLLVGVDYADWRMHPEVSRAARRQVLADGRAAVGRTLEVLAGRPEVLAVSVGNEVPADIARLYGRGAVEDTLSALVAQVHAGDPELLATYTSYPTSEFLRVEGQDLATFNVFLESAEKLAPYLRHLQRVTTDRPLVITELGLAAELHGDEEQARSLSTQLELVDLAGCAGATVFSWTDEWAVHAEPVTGWGFGLTRVDRSPRPALEVAAGWARRSLREARATWPSITAVVCAYNEEQRIEDCLASLARVEYPAFQVVVCDDGSTDRTAEQARRSGFEVLALRHGGLSAARNAGLAAADGEIVAYLDADAACHADWPFHLALAFDDPAVVAAGGPNLPWPAAALVERAVSFSPGNPVEVLVGDDQAEHVPGCNLAVRRSALTDIGGFDVLFTTAGDDVDVCWRLLDLGGRIGFSAAAQVHHHRRATVRGYLRQQRGYGRAERMLAGLHRHRFNRLGAARWSGFVYAGPRVLPRMLRPVVYHGAMGTAPYQTELRDRTAQVGMWTAALLPLVVVLGLLALPLALAHPGFLALPSAVAVLVVGYAASVAAAVRPARGEPSPGRLRALVALLHVMQPFVRTWGRVSARPLPARPAPRTGWTGQREHWLHDLHRELSSGWCAVRPGGPHDGWDLEVRAGPLLRCRLNAAVRWEWDPVASRRWALSNFAVATLVVAVLLLALEPTSAAVVLGVVAAGAALEALALRRVTERAVARTTVAVEPAT